jgi:C4-dicarboxylate transporter DctM subunit
MALVLMAYIWRTAGRMGIAAEAKPTLGELWAALRDALIPLGMPAIIFGGILGGIMTPTEASVLAVLYAAVVGLFVYREIEWKALPGIIMNAAMITGAVGLLLGTAGVVSWFLTVQQMPAAMIQIMTVVPGSSVIFLFITAAIFIFFGAVIGGSGGGDPAAGLLPVAAGLGIDDPLRHRDRGRGGYRALPAADRWALHRVRDRRVSVDRAPRDAAFVAVLLLGLVIIVLVPRSPGPAPPLQAALTGHATEVAPLDLLVRLEPGRGALVTICPLFIT